MCRIYEYNYTSDISSNLILELKERESEQSVEQPKPVEEVLYREPKNMPASVRGNKKIEFGSKTMKPQSKDSFIHYTVLNFY